jgi:hypothetical protein
VEDGGWRQVLLVCGKRSFEASGADAMLAGLESGFVALPPEHELAPRGEAALDDNRLHGPASVLAGAWQIQPAATTRTIRGSP